MRPSVCCTGASVILIDPAEQTRKDNYKLLIGAVVPRPIAWVSSLSMAGVPNLAPFSYFTIACQDPPMLLFCPQRRADGTIKDTQRNIAATGEFVLHIVSEALVGSMNQTAAEYPPELSEWEQTQLAAAPSLRVAPPRIADAPIAFECRVEQQLGVGGATGADIIVGRVLLAHIRDDVYEDGYVRLERLQPVGRLAGHDYARVTDTFSLPRPVYQPEEARK
ncbi:MAG: hypothetical protein CYG59_06085 [Chloroflexi bacterium]|nr:MAG: hypothetical protein CYG59_06085 [Chloroflexota bacterium]